MDELRQLKSSGNIITKIELRRIILEVKYMQRTQDRKEADTAFQLENMEGRACSGELDVGWKVIQWMLK